MRYDRMDVIIYWLQINPLKNEPLFFESIHKNSTNAHVFLIQLKTHGYCFIN